RVTGGDFAFEKGNLVYQVSATGDYFEGPDANGNVDHFMAPAGKKISMWTTQGVAAAKLEGEGVSIPFDFDKSEIPPGSAPTLEGLARRLKENPNPVTVQIEGYADAVGTPQYNQSLSERRAHEIGQGLIDRGVEPEQIAEIGYGESKAAVSETASEEARQPDRKGVIVVKPETPVAQGSGNVEEHDYQMVFTNDGLFKDAGIFVYGNNPGRDPLNQDTSHTNRLVKFDRANNVYEQYGLTKNLGVDAHTGEATAVFQKEFADGHKENASVDFYHSGTDVLTYLGFMPQLNGVWVPLAKNQIQRETQAGEIWDPISAVAGMSQNDKVVNTIKYGAEDIEIKRQGKDGTITIALKGGEVETEAVPPVKQFIVARLNPEAVTEGENAATGGQQPLSGHPAKVLATVQLKEKIASEEAIDWHMATVDGLAFTANPYATGFAPLFGMTQAMEGVHYTRESSADTIVIGKSGDKTLIALRHGGYTLLNGKLIIDPGSDTPDSKANSGNNGKPTPLGPNSGPATLILGDTYDLQNFSMTGQDGNGKPITLVVNGTAIFKFNGWGYQDVTVSSPGGKQKYEGGKLTGFQTNNPEDTKDIQEFVGAKDGWIDPKKYNEFLNSHVIFKRNDGKKVVLELPPGTKREKDGSIKLETETTTVPALDKLDRVTHILGGLIKIGIIGWLFEDDVPEDDSLSGYYYQMAADAVASGVSPSGFMVLTSRKPLELVAQHGDVWTTDDGKNFKPKSLSSLPSEFNTKQEGFFHGFNTWIAGRSGLKEREEARGMDWNRVAAVQGLPANATSEELRSSGSREMWLSAPARPIVIGADLLNAVGSAVGAGISPLLDIPAYYLGLSENPTYFRDYYAGQVVKSVTPFAEAAVVIKDALAFKSTGNGDLDALLIYLMLAGPALELLGWSDNIIAGQALLFKTGRVGELIAEHYLISSSIALGVAGESVYLSSVGKEWTWSGATAAAVVPATFPFLGYGVGYGGYKVAQAVGNSSNIFARGVTAAIAGYPAITAGAVVGGAFGGVSNYYLGNEKTQGVLGYGRAIALGVVGGTALGVGVTAAGWGTRNVIGLVFGSEAKASGGSGATSAIFQSFTTSAKSLFSSVPTATATLYLGNKAVKATDGFGIGLDKVFSYPTSFVERALEVAGGAGAYLGGGYGISLLNEEVGSKVSDAGASMFWHGLSRANGSYIGWGEGTPGMTTLSGVFAKVRKLIST
ncbi:MAG: OmpA family protein, partial [Candidatus Omnitrophica bacterium]|nr:OmpA family protein [Candidatus Omnitrophota bacterium]